MDGWTCKQTRVQRIRAREKIHVKYLSYTKNPKNVTIKLKYEKNTHLKK